MTFRVSNRGGDHPRSIAVSRKTPPPAERLVFVDIEPAGLQSWRPIMQIAAIAVTRTGKELETFERKIRFDERQATKRALRKRQYCPERWQREGRPAHYVAHDFGAFLSRHATLTVSRCDRRYARPLVVAQMVAHNAAFDGPFLREWFERHRLFLPADYRVFCTLQRAMWLFQEYPSLIPPEDFKLGTLCRYFGVPWSHEYAHDALFDVRATVNLYRRMQEIMLDGNHARADVSAA